MAGTSNITGLESILFADNISFDGTERAGAMTLDGQLFIGSTTLPHVRKGLITSSDGSITWTFGNGTISGVVAGGTSVGKTITGNSGGALSPTAGNWNILGSGSITTTGATSTLTLSLTGLTANSVLYGLGTATIGLVPVVIDGVLISSHTGVPSLLPNSGTAGWVLTANTGAPPSWQALPGGGVTSAIGTANQVLVNGLSGGGNAQTGAVTFTTPQDIATTSSVQFGNVTLGNAGALRTDTTTAHTALIQGYNGSSYVTFATITNAATPTFSIAASLGSLTTTAFGFQGATNYGMTLSGTTLQLIANGTAWLTVPSGGTIATAAGLTTGGLNTFASGGLLLKQITDANATIANLTTTSQILFSTNTGARTLSIASANAGQVFWVKDAAGTAAAAPITITPASGTIDNAANYTINQNFGSVIIVRDGTNYWTFGNGGNGGSVVGSWVDKGTSFAALSGVGYFVTGTATATLPASPVQGNTIRFSVDTASLLTITANTGQIIRLGSTATAAAGTCVNTQQGDSIELVYRTSDTTWIAQSAVGAWNLT